MRKGEGWSKGIWEVGVVGTKEVRKRHFLRTRVNLMEHLTSVFAAFHKRYICVKCGKDQVFAWVLLRKPSVH